MSWRARRALLEDLRMKPPESPEVPEASAEDGGETPNGGRRLLRRLRNRSEPHAAAASHVASGDDRNGPGQPRTYVRLTDDWATDESSTAEPPAAIAAAERELAQRKAELLHALRAAQAADADAAQAQADAEAAAEEAQRVGEHQAAERERLQEEAAAAVEAARAHRRTEAE